MKMFTLFLSLCLANIIYAGDHPMSKITGENIDLSTKGHTIAGRVGDKLIFGDVSETGHKESQLTLRSEEGIVSTSFKLTNGAWGGAITINNQLHEIKLVRLDRNQSAYIIAVNKAEYTVKIIAEDFQGNHFINPTYVLELEDGRQISAKMHEGRACWMYSLHLIFMIFGSYLV